jgi:hypothetical protein
MSILVLALGIVSFQAQAVVVKGTVIDSTTGQSLYGARIQVEGKPVGAISEFDGSFEFEYEGSEPFTIVAYMMGYNEWSTQISQLQDPEVVLEVRLGMKQIALEGVTKTARRITHSESAVLLEMKKLNSIGNAVSGAQISKSQDRDAAQVAKRVPGVTVIDDRFVMVRGLTERYNTVLLNNVIAPSVETDVRAFSFDLIPSNMIDRMIIFKSPTPDLPGDFAGGVIKVYTRNIPERNQLSLSYTSAFRNGTTFQPFLINPGSPTDWLGFDNGQRDLPGGFPANVRMIDVSDETALNTIGKSLPNTWNYDEIRSVRPDHRVGINIARRFSLGSMDLGNITSISYSNTSTHFSSNRLDYNSYNTAIQTSDTIFHYVDDIYQRKARVGIMHNWSLRINDNNAIEFRSILNQAGDNETTLRNGVNYEEGGIRKEFAFHYTERTIYTGQLSGRHQSENEKALVDWAIGYTASSRNEPDWRRVRYSKPLDDTAQPFQVYIPTSANPFFLGRLYLSMREQNQSAAVNVQRNLKAKKEPSKPFVKVGGWYDAKQRDFAVRNLGYALGNPFFFDWTIAELPLDSVFAPENINAQTGLKIDEDTKKSDSYTATNRLLAGYAMASFPVGNLTLTGGIRIENNLQKLNSNEYNGDTVIVNNNVTRALPSINASYNIGESMLVRAAYGRTVNRPEFRELAPLYFYDFVFNAIYTGEDSLRTPSIDNFDLRWEMYTRPGEIISVAGFYKRFVNPIEMYFVVGGSGGTRTFSFRNAPEAVSLGVEVEIRKSMKDLVKSANWLDNFSVLFNGSLIQSNIVLTNDPNSTEQDRPMMGQSPYILNTGLFYQNDSIKLQASLLYNVIGPRVVIVGIPGIPEVYEMPRGNLDLTISKAIGKHVDVRFGVQDLLNREFVLLQDANDDGKLENDVDQRMQFLKRGSYYSLSVALKI